MIYPGMPDTYRFQDCKAFWYEGEFWLTSNEDNEYFDDVNELLLRMLQIAPYYKWENIDILES